MSNQSCFDFGQARLRNIVCPCSIFKGSCPTHTKVIWRKVVLGLVKMTRGLVMLDDYGQTFKISYAAYQPTVVILVPHINIDTQKVMSTFGLLAGCKESCVQ